MRRRSVFAETKTLAVASAIFALLIPLCHAQPFPESSRQKIQKEQKKANDKATDEAYKAYMKRTPNADKKVDPWGSMRAPSTGK
jgi:hypothetical protein